MKIVNFTPGLGNQIFEYIFSRYLGKTFPKEKIYGYYNPKFLNKHNGLEVYKMFEIELPPSTRWSNFVAFLCRALARLIPNIKSTDCRFNTKSTYYDGWWQDKRYFLDTIGEIKYLEPVLSVENNSLIKKICSSESISIHVRRGDYLEPKNAKQYGGICTLDYYSRAISIVKTKFANPIFFVFSNDIDWCKKNLAISDAVFVTNNVGENSWLDMYLMSHCKANILANSSFSYWGAMMNKNNNIVVYPGKWFNGETPDIFPDNWIGL